MHPHTQAAVDLLRRLIATPSVSREETAVADIVAQYLQQHGCEPRRHGNNVWAMSPRFDASRPAILLNAHLDTVKPVSGWQRNPFEPLLEGDRLYGLGSNDCGGGLVSLLHTFLTPSSSNLIFLASAEEEVSGKGGIESVLPLLPHVGFAIVGEPTGMQPAIAEKGLMVVDAVARGKAGHAARDEGVNAIYVAMDDVAQLACRPDATSVSPLFPKVSPLLGAVRTTVTVIAAGTQHNVVPDECRFTIDVRSNECYSNEQIFNILQQHLKSELHARSFRLSSSSIPDTHPFVRCCVAHGLTPFGSPTLSDQALMPFPSLKLGPGQSARSHTADEFICISEIDHALSLYQQLLSEEG